MGSRFKAIDCTITLYGTPEAIPVVVNPALYCLGGWDTKVEKKEDGIKYTCVRQRFNPVATTMMHNQFRRVYYSLIPKRLMKLMTMEFDCNDELKGVYRLPFPDEKALDVGSATMRIRMRKDTNPASLYRSLMEHLKGWEIGTNLEEDEIVCTPMDSFVPGLTAYNRGLVVAYHALWFKEGVRDITVDFPIGARQTGIYWMPRTEMKGKRNDLLGFV